MSTQDSVPVGTRFCASSGHLGTIKYVGPVDGTKGMWFGVEWDDPGRGKHDGVRDGRRYLTCRVSNAGSFIRPSKSLCFGVSFLTALSAKYVDETLDPSEEKIVLGTPSGAIEVEAVGFDKVRSRLRALERLRGVSLDNQNVAFSDTPGRICRTCPNIRELDLSANLIASWHVVASISVELPRLERLILNRNRFLPPQLSTTALTHVVELQLNDTLITWEDFKAVASFMPGLKTVELGYNRLASLIDTHQPSSPLASIQSLNLDTNMLDDWSSTAFSLSEFVALHRLVLSCNGVRAIGLLHLDHSPLVHLRSLVLSGNQLHDWSDVDRLPRWCPNLESLSLAGNPLTEVGEHARHSRQFIVARIPTLLVLDLTAISSKERSDSELFYLSFVAKSVPGSDEARRDVHPQWNVLCQKHGRPAERSSSGGDEDKLSKFLISINVYHCSTPPDDRQSYTDPPIPMKVLSTMKMRTFRLKLIKTFRLLSSTVIQVWLRMQDGFVELEDDSQSLDWFGIDSQSDVFVYAKEQ